jgi:hypothetical protein
MANRTIQNFLNQMEMIVLSGLFSGQHWVHIRNAIEIAAANGAAKAIAEHVEGIDISNVDTSQGANIKVEKPL